MKKKFLGNKLMPFGMALAIGFALAATGCDTDQEAAIIRVTNDASENIRVAIFRFDSESEREIQRHSVNSVAPGQTVIWQDDPGDFRILVVGPPFNAQYNFPRGGGTSRVRLSGTINFSFDGENIVRK
jgi:hypothetical protein